MKTASTLCATATVVGASAVGLSFGREAPSHAPADRARATPARQLHPRPMSAVVHATAPSASLSAPLSTSISARQFSAPVPLPSSARVPLPPRHSHDGRSQRRVAARRMPSVGPAPRSSHSTAMTASSARSEGDLDELDPVALPASRRASWMKRLSGISASQTSSRNTSPGPLSPAMSASNGSMAFSHDGSTAPMVGERLPPPLPPNKLVKRSSSVRVGGEAQLNGAGSRLSSFRRPATSHQRSATLQQQTAFLERRPETGMSGFHPSDYGYGSGDVTYTRYFRAYAADDEPRVRRRSASAAGTIVKRVYPDVNHKPTLLLATSVRASAAVDDLDDLISETGESVFYISRPGTPMSLSAVIANEGEVNSEMDAGRGRPSTVDDRRRSRRSFSITGFLSPRADFKKQRIAGAKLVRRASQRASSAPLLTMPKRQIGTAPGELTEVLGRRDSSEPRSNLSTSAGPTQSGNLKHGRLVDTLAMPSSPAPALAHLATSPAERTSAPAPSGEIEPPAPAFSNHALPSPSSLQTGGRPARLSMAPSEPASTLVGSDNEGRGLVTGDEDDADLHSDTMFDSLRTGATRSTTGARGPRIETIFDESPPSKVKVTALRDLLPKGTFRETAADAAHGQQSIAEEDESISTPVQTVVPDRSVRGSPSFSRGSAAPLVTSLMPSSPPDMPRPLSLGTLEWDQTASNNSSSRWSLEADDDADSWGDFPVRSATVNVATPILLTRHNVPLPASSPSFKPTASQPPTFDHGDRDARSSIFDWSEQPLTDRTADNRTPPRPSTVHGKKDADSRGSRSVGRRVTSGLHARSQSVPVVPDPTGKRSTVVTNKFGTWGVGSKGVTEDWNDDFDFADLGEETPVGGREDSQKIDSGTAMVVPNHIQKQQSNVLANIGLLREWGLLIEELKEQRNRGASLDVLQGPHAGMWEEVDAMIDLADQEAEHDGVPRLSPPSSPAFDEDAFDDVSRASPSLNREARRSPAGRKELGGQWTPEPSSQNARPRRKSILPPNDHVFAPQSSPTPSHTRYRPQGTSADARRITGRPRKDSEAKARSVIEALQKRKSTHETLADPPPPSSSKKVPFDTATLRRIVPYVNTLTRQAKDALREAEGSYSESSMTPAKENEPPHSNVLQPTDNELAAQMKLMTVM